MARSIEYQKSGGSKIFSLVEELNVTATQSGEKYNISIEMIELRATNFYIVFHIFNFSSCFH